MVYEFKCYDCDVVIQHVQSIKDELPDYKVCPKCGKHAGILITAAAVLTGGMSQASDDVRIGQEAAKRWDRIYGRREERNKVRRESGKRAVVGTIKGSGDHEFETKDFKTSDKKLQFVELKKPPKED